MKKIMITMVSIFLLAACNGDLEVDIQYELTANIDVSTIVQGMRDGNNKDYFSMEREIPVHLMYLVYDEKGDLVFEAENKLDNFFTKSSFSTALKTGNYTIVAWACTYRSDNPTWTAEDKNTLNTFVIKLREDMDAGDCPILGVNKMSVTIDKTQEINIDVQTVGSFFCLVFTYSPFTKADEVIWFGYYDSESYVVSTEKTNFISSQSYLWAYYFTVNLLYTGSYGGYFTLPMEHSILWGAFSGDDVLRASTLLFKAEAGKHQVININIETGVETITPTSRSNASLSDNNNMERQIVEVGKMKTEPIELSQQNMLSKFLKLLVR